MTRSGNRADRFGVSRINKLGIHYTTDSIYRARESSEREGERERDSWPLTYTISSTWLILSFDIRSYGKEKQRQRKRSRCLASNDDERGLFFFLQNKTKKVFDLSQLGHRFSNQTKMKRNQANISCKREKSSFQTDW